MKPSEWPRMPGPWSFVAGLRAGVAVGLVGLIVLLAACQTTTEERYTGPGSIPQAAEQCRAQPELAWCKAPAN